MAILTVWHRCADLDVMLALARSHSQVVIRGAGGNPQVAVFEIVPRPTGTIAE